RLPGLGVSMTLVDSGAGPMFEAQQLGRASVAHELPVGGLAASPDGRVLYSVANGHTPEALLRDGSPFGRGSVGVWDLATGRKARSLGKDLPAPVAVAVSPDGALLLVGHADGTATLWVGGLLDGP